MKICCFYNESLDRSQKSDMKCPEASNLHISSRHTSTSPDHQPPLTSSPHHPHTPSAYHYYHSPSTGSNLERSPPHQLLSPGYHSASHLGVIHPQTIPENQEVNYDSSASSFFQIAPSPLPARLMANPRARKMSMFVPSVTVTREPGSEKGVEGGLGAGHNRARRFSEPFGQAGMSLGGGTGGAGGLLASMTLRRESVAKAMSNFPKVSIYCPGLKYILLFRYKCTGIVYFRYCRSEACKIYQKNVSRVETFVNCEQMAPCMNSSLSVDSSSSLYWRYE